MLLREQSETFLKTSATRRRDPVCPRTLRAYQSYIRNWIVPVLGNEEVENVRNPQAKRLIDRMSQSGLSPRTETAVVNCLKAIVASALNEEGEELYPRTWNSDFMDLPSVERSDAPVIALESLSEALGRSQEQDKALYATLAGTGLRIGEALSLSREDDGLSSIWDEEAAVIRVRSTLDHQQGEIQANPKTQAGIRQVDVCPELNDFLHAVVPPRGLLFQKNGRPLVYSTARRRLIANGIPEAFHAFRRFRVTHLESENVPPRLIQYWIGHAAQNVTESYARMGKNLEVRRRECERAGLGFQLP